MLVAKQVAIGSGEFLLVLQVLVLQSVLPQEQRTLSPPLKFKPFLAVHACLQWAKPLMATPPECRPPAGLHQMQRGH